MSFLGLVNVIFAFDFCWLFLHRSPHMTKPDKPIDISLEGLEKIMRFADSNAALVVAALLDRALIRAISTKLIPLTRTMSGRIFEGHGPLYGFAAKIDMAYALSLITKETHEDLLIINKIRVKFAHSLKLRYFSDPDIKELLFKLSGWENKNDDPSINYMDTMKEIELILERIYVEHCRAIGVEPENVDPSLLS